MNFLLQRKFSILLFSYLLLLLGPVLFPKTIREEAVFVVLLINILTGLLIFYTPKKKKVLRFLIFLTLGLLVLRVIDFSISWEQGKAYSGILYLLYFFFLSVEVYTQIYRSKEITTEIIAAVFCGFIMLGLIGSFIFTIVEVLEPNSFSSLGSGPEVFSNLIYFSFISLLTIGYGDIIPITQAAKQTALIIGLAGHFYTVFVTAIILGQFIAHKKSITSNNS